MAKMSKQDRMISRTLYSTLDLRGWIFATVTILAVWAVGVLLPLRLAVLLSLLGIAASVVGLAISARAIKAGKHDPLFPIWLGGGLGFNDGKGEFFFFHFGNKHLMRDGIILAEMMPEGLRERWTVILEK